jgi:hypothetical protein
VLTNRVARVPPSYSKNSKSSSPEPHSLESYDSYLCRAWHPETSEYEAEELNALFLAAEKSKIFQEEICKTMHVVCLSREGYTPDLASLSSKLEGHMGFTAITSAP